MIILFKPKGGVRLRLSAHISHALVRRVQGSIGDADPQGSARAAARIDKTNSFPVVGLDQSTIHCDSASANKDFDHACD